eukprot:TRINITY_DN1115_c0_g1_i1.p1 TRINITY_DN1115_c0_g1~~TRINITY_DN1115_c0_g1_i1.p1  ORF type:complete len:745 (-),score=149.03 TRINITY_DN1115_c0_g1_i1:1209-3443(-)
MSNKENKWQTLTESSELQNHVYNKILKVWEGREQSNEQLGLFLGVYVPSMISSFGLVIFLRLGFIAGIAGLIDALLMIILSFAVICTSATSLAAIATNGKIGDGGAYFIISRSLGPEFGGSVGIIYFLGNVLSVTLNMTGFTEVICSLIPELPNTIWWRFLYSSILLLFVTVLSGAGSKFISRFSVILLGITFLSLSWSSICFFIRNPGNFLTGFTGFSLTTLQENLYSHYPFNFSFKNVFGIFFPSFVGIIGGINNSGSLKSNKIIPMGFFFSLVTVVFAQLFLILLLLSTMKYMSLMNNYFVMIDISYVGWLVSFGVLVTLTASTLSSISGAALVLQALSKDKLLPLIEIFAKGSGPANEPHRAIFAAYFFSQLLLFLPSLNTIAQMTTMSYLMCFLFINFACFFVTIINAPNWRPLFKYFHWTSALLGTILCLFTMFFVAPIEAGIGMALLITIFCYIHIRSPAVDWGYISQALIFQQLRKFLLLYDIKKQHLKFWRPQFLLLVANPKTTIPLISFVNSMKKGGIYTIGTVEIGLWQQKIQIIDLLRDKWNKLIESLQIEAFSEITIAPTVRQGCQNLILNSGISGLKPNTVIIGFFDMYQAPQAINPSLIEEQVNTCLSEFPSLRETHSKMTAEEYISLFNDCINANKNVLIARNFINSTNFKTNLFSILNSNTFIIDVWLVPLSELWGIEGKGEIETFSLTLLLAHICSLKNYGTISIKKSTKLRVFSFTSCVEKKVQQ